VLLWSLTADKLGRRAIINICETSVCVILFVVGGLYWTGATTGNAAAGTALVRIIVFACNNRDLVLTLSQLVICCIWTFLFQIVAMSYYVYSAELPSAVLRSKSFIHPFSFPLTDMTQSKQVLSLGSPTQSLVSQLGMSHNFISVVEIPANIRSYATPPMLLALSVKAGFVYGALSVPLCIIFWLYLPETKRSVGRKLR
jgi:MFS transporter, SP family, general alpha glucoside:H+ symporter